MCEQRPQTRERDGGRGRGIRARDVGTCVLPFEPFAVIRYIYMLECKHELNTLRSTSEDSPLLGSSAPSSSLACKPLLPIDVLSG